MFIGFLNNFEMIDWGDDDCDDFNDCCNLVNLVMCGLDMEGFDILIDLVMG